jgi:hypothetical protein
LICVPLIAEAVSVPGAEGGVVSGVVIDVTSLAVLFVVFVSPPPDTVAVLVTLEGALLETFTVSVTLP